MFDGSSAWLKKQTEAAGPKWHLPMRPGERRKLDPLFPLDALTEQIEQKKTSIRKITEQPFQVLEQQFELKRLRYRGLATNTAQFTTMFALSNLWMARRILMASA